jgi:hypothetical protein
VHEAQRMHVSMRDTTRWYQPFGYGLGWELGRLHDDTLHVATGGFVGYASHVSFSKSRRVGVIALVNESTYGSALLDAAVRSAYAVAFNQTSDLKTLAQSMEPYRDGVTRRRAALQQRIERVAAVRPLSLQASRYPGTYTNGIYGALEVTGTGGRLFVKLGPLESEVEVRTAGADTIRVELVPNQGSNMLFLPSGESVDSLRYLGTIFRRRR